MHEMQLASYVIVPLYELSNYFDDAVARFHDLRFCSFECFRAVELVATVGINLALHSVRSQLRPVVPVQSSYMLVWPIFPMSASPLVSRKIRLHVTISLTDDLFQKNTSLLDLTGK